MPDEALLRQHLSKLPVLYRAAQHARPACEVKKMTKRMRLHILLTVCVLIAAGRAFGADWSLEQGGLRLGFSAEAGQLTELSDTRVNHAFLDAGEPALGLWELQFMDGPRGALQASDAKAFSHRSDSPARAELCWSDFGLAAAPDLQVTVSVTLEAAEALSRWRIAVAHAGSLRIARVVFPRVSWIARQEQEVLAVPYWMGEATTKARALLSAGGKGQRLDWEYPGRMSLQCMAFYKENGPGLALSCEDTEALNKTFAAVGNPAGGVGLQVEQLPELGGNASDEYRAPYDVLLRPFTGDWFTAAEHYRDWAARQPWARAGRDKRGAMPAWVTDTALWVWNRGRSENVLPPAEALRDRLGLPVSVFWHWWHGCAYDAGFPEYLPPREGTEAFTAAVSAAHAREVHAIVYMNQRLWGMKTRSWTERGAERYAVKGTDGQVHAEVYNRFLPVPCAPMCMGTAFWRDTYAGLAEEVLCKLGVDGIYMDQACSSLPCFDPGHGHPLGGGSYWMRGFQTLSEEIRRRAAPVRQAVLAGEGCGEAWLPYLDLMLSLQVSVERYSAPGDWEPIPFFHAVYHDCGIFFGNYSSLTVPPYDDLWPRESAPKEPLRLLDRKFSRQFCLEQARAFVWGQQPTLANFLPRHLEERAEELDFVLRLARLRHAAAKYLLSGTALRPPRVDVADTELEMSRLSIYAGQGETVREFKKTCMPVLASAWRAADGTVAVVLVSILDTPVEFTLNLDGKSYGITPGWHSGVLDETGEKPMGEVSAVPLPLQVSLPPRGARVYTFSKE